MRPAKDMSVDVKFTNEALESMALLADLYGMFAENQHRVACGESIAYGEEAFSGVADQLRALKEDDADGPFKKAD